MVGGNPAVERNGEELRQRLMGRGSDDEAADKGREALTIGQKFAGKDE